MLAKSDPPPPSSPPASPPPDSPPPPPPSPAASGAGAGAPPPPPPRGLTVAHLVVKDPSHRKVTSFPDFLVAVLEHPQGPLYESICFHCPPTSPYATIVGPGVIITLTQIFDVDPIACP